MLVPNQYVEVKMSGKTISHYRELGYNVKDVKTKLIVPIEHLTKGSHIKIDLICDYCKKSFKREYKTYLQCTENGIDYCENCGKGIKTKQTIKEKYGVENIRQLELVKEKTKKTNLERYGVEVPVFSPIIREKINTTLLRNDSISTSSQQIYIYDILKTKYQNIEKNYLCDNSFFDVGLFIDNIKIDVEYDGWYWHQNKQRDRRRDEHFKSQGWKILRIRSGHLLPTEEQLFEAIEQLVTTDRKFKEIILDDWKEGEDSA